MRLTSSWAASALCIVSSAIASTTYVPRNASAVLDLPATIKADEYVTVHLNISNSKDAEDEQKYLKIYAWAYTQKETADDLTSGDPRLYCLLEDCVATNLSTFAINFPADALPDTRMLLSYSLFGSDKVSWSSWGDQQTYFNLTGGEATLSAWELANSWNLVSHWSNRMPCSSVPCARTCMETYLDVDRPTYSQPNRTEFNDCVAACPGILPMGSSLEGRTCITKNETAESVQATASAATSSSDATAAASTAVTATTSGPSGAATGESMASTTELQFLGISFLAVMATLLL